MTMQLDRDPSPLKDLLVFHPLGLARLKEIEAMHQEAVTQWIKYPRLITLDVEVSNFEKWYQACQFCSCWFRRTLPRRDYCQCCLPQRMDYQGSPLHSIVQSQELRFLILRYLAPVQGRNREVWKFFLRTVLCARGSRFYRLMAHSCLEAKGKNEWVFYYDTQIEVWGPISILDYLLQFLTSFRNYTAQ